MWHLIETNTSKSQLIPEYGINSLSNFLILKNAIYSFFPDYEVSTLSHGGVNPTGLALWVLCLIIFIVTETDSEQLLDKFERGGFLRKFE